MLIHTLAFYLFAFIAVASGVLVITARNPVHSVLFLILAFFTSAGLFVLIGAEFIAMILVIVYVGAVAVLFLFVVMMLDIDFVELREGFATYMPTGIVVGLLLLGELAMVLGAKHIEVEAKGVSVDNANTAISQLQVTNTEAIGNVLYTDYVYMFQACGLILFVGMIGAIVLTLRRRPGVRKQNIGQQVGRRREDSVELVKVQPRQGV